jgi:hypothetical protein
VRVRVGRGRLGGSGRDFFEGLNVMHWLMLTSPGGKKCAVNMARVNKMHEVDGGTWLILGNQADEATKVVETINEILCHWARAIRMSITGDV